MGTKKGQMSCKFVVPRGEWAHLLLLYRMLGLRSLAQMVRGSSDHPSTAHFTEEELTVVHSNLCPLRGLFGSRGFRNQNRCQKGSAFWHFCHIGAFTCSHRVVDSLSHPICVQFDGKENARGRANYFLLLQRRLFSKWSLQFTRFCCLI